jgi:hypothetical protein
MDSAELRKLSNRKISVAILVWVIIIFLLFFLNQCSKNHQLKKEISKIRKEIKVDYEQRIKKRDLIINNLEKDNQYKKIEIDRINKKLDSLDKLKNKIIIEYVDKIQQIKVMDSEKIKNYWNGQFN